MAENLTPKKYIDSNNMKQILTAVKNEIHSDDSIITTEAEYLALPEEQKLNNSYYLYDIGVHYKNGVAYSRKKPITLTMEEYKALGEVDPDQEYIVSADEQGILLSAEDIGYNNAESGIQATTVQGAIDKVNGKLGELINDAKVTTTNTFSSDKIKAIANDIRKFTLSKTDYQGVEAYPTECGVYRVVKKIDGMPNDASQYAALIIYGNGYFTHIYHDIVSGRMWIGYTADSVKAPTWKELATMDKVESKYEEVTLATPVDWNTLNTKARYYVPGGAIMTNAPMQQPFGELVVETAGDGSTCRVQKFFSFDGKLYIRRWSGSVWNEWYKFDGTAN